MLTYVDLWQIFKLYNRNWYILAILLTGATVFGTSMGMLTVSPCYRFSAHPSVLEAEHLHDRMLVSRPKLPGTRR
jgi:capsular polysaccharide biosynthesis protein